MKYVQLMMYVLIVMQKKSINGKLNQYGIVRKKNKKDY